MEISTHFGNGKIKKLKLAKMGMGQMVKQTESRQKSTYKFL